MMSEAERIRELAMLDPDLPELHRRNRVMVSGRDLSPLAAQSVPSGLLLLEFHLPSPGGSTWATSHRVRRTDESTFVLWPAQWEA